MTPQEVRTKIKEIVLTAARKYIPDLHADLVYWDDEPAPAWEDLAVELQWLSDREEILREVDVSEEPDEIELKQSSLQLLTVRLKFESLNVGAEPDAYSLGGRMRQWLNSRAMRLQVSLEDLALLGTAGPVTRFPMVVDGRDEAFLILETKWRYELWFPEAGDSFDRIKTVVYEGEASVENTDGELDLIDISGTVTAPEPEEE